MRTAHLELGNKAIYNMHSVRNRRRRTCTQRTLSWVNRRYRLFIKCLFHVSCYLSSACPASPVYPTQVILCAYALHCLRVCMRVWLARTPITSACSTSPVYPTQGILCAYVLHCPRVCMCIWLARTIYIIYIWSSPCNPPPSPGK